MRAYLRVDPELADAKKSYPDGALAAFLCMLCAAEAQPHRGRFKTLRILRAHLERKSRWIPFLLDKNDLTILPNGTYYVVGWDEWQEGDWTVRERVQRIRKRQQEAHSVTPDVTVDVTVGTVTGAVNTPRLSAIAVSGKRLAVSGKQDEGVKPPGRLRRFVMPRRGFRGGETTPLLEHLPKTLESV